jgi:hypothetical protein
MPVTDHDHSGHDHADHDHADPHRIEGDPHATTERSGADVVRELTRGYGLVSLLLPVLALVAFVVLAAAVPTGGEGLFIGFALGGLQLIVQLLGGAATTWRRVGTGPARLLVVLATAVVVELLRLPAVLLGSAWVPADALARGLWIGAGAAALQIAIAVVQAVLARRQMGTPSDVARSVVDDVLEQRVTGTRVVALQTLGNLSAVVFSLGASALVSVAPPLVVATVVLAVVTAIASWIVQLQRPADRPRSPWQLAAPVLALLVLALALVAAAA